MFGAKALRCAQAAGIAISRCVARFLAVLLCFVGSAALAAPPAFTGASARGSGALSLINLRAQGVITGTAPMTVRVDGISVRDRTSPLVSAIPVFLLPGARSSVCLQVTKPPGLGIEFSRLGVELQLTVFNAEAPAGVSGRIAIETGSASVGTSPAACADVVVAAPVADAGADQAIADRDGQPGELVVFNGTGSRDADGRIVSYRWLDAGNQELASGATATARLRDGQHTVTLIATDDSGASGSDTVNVTIAAPTGGQVPVANAGPDQVVADTDGQGGENVTLDGTGSSDPDGRIVSHEWLLGQASVQATGATATVRLPDGTHTVTLRVTDNNGDVATDTLTLTVNAAATAGGAPSANAGTDRRVNDTDAVAGENVVLDGSGSSDVDGAIAGYQWLLNGQTLGAGVSPSVRLPDGESFVTLLVTDDTGNTASDGVLITVAPAATSRPVANAGSDQTLADSDSREGEEVLLDASASRGAITSYQWLADGREVARGVNATLRLADGDHVLTLVVLDDQGNTASDVVQIAVARATVVPVLAELPGLTPNQRSVAGALDALCPRLAALPQGVTSDQADLLARCAGIQRSGIAQQITALEELSAQDLNATRTQTFNLSQSQLANLADRLIALRGGARGLSLTGLNLESDGQGVPLQQVAAGLRGLLGGAASADATPDELLDKRVGIWLRGNYSFGSKERGRADSGFDATQWGLIGGVDYRFSPVNILGAAIGYGRSQADFSPAGSGDLQTTAVTAALYATMYTRRGFYVDAIASYLKADYASDRRILFAEDDALIDVTAHGTTSGGTLGVAFTFGYDWSFGAFTIAPTIGYNYMMSQIERFRERGAAGLDLEYEQQDYVSATTNGGLRLSYALQTGIGVFLPQIRGEYVREFIRDTEAFGVRFANDPFEDTPLIMVTSDEPDQSYMRIAAGVSAQLRHGISGFVEYQRLVGNDMFSFADVAFGVRIESSFE